MSELVPFFDEDEVLDDNLLRSIETLLDDNEQASNGLNRREQSATTIAESGMIDVVAATTTPPMTPTSPPTVVPQFGSANNGSFSLGNQVYQKWSTNESGGMKRNYTGRNHQSRSTNYTKSGGRKNTLPVNAMRYNADIAQCQAILAEKANQLLTQYLRR